MVKYGFIPQGGAKWGEINGNLPDQTDLYNDLQEFDNIAKKHLLRRRFLEEYIPNKVFEDQNILEDVFINSPNNPFDTFDYREDNTGKYIYLDHQTPGDSGFIQGLFYANFSNIDQLSIDKANDGDGGSGVEFRLYVSDEPKDGGNRIYTENGDNSNISTGKINTSNISGIKHINIEITAGNAPASYGGAKFRIYRLEKTA